MTTNLKVQVRVADLIKRIEQVQAEEVARYNREKEAYPEKKKAWEVKVREALVAASKKPLRFNYSGQVIVSTPKAPSEPQQPRTQTFQRDIATLRMCATETLSISTDDRFSRYL